MSSPKKRNKLLTRSVMDLPTTDPGSDFADFTTDEEYETDYENDGQFTAVTKTTIMRVPKIRTEPFIRKSSSVSYEQSLMPPELIITKVLPTKLLHFRALLKKFFQFIAGLR